MLTAFADLSTPLVADACVRLRVPLRVAPAGVAAVVAGHRVAGRALPVRHYGSVDVFLEAFAAAAEGDVLVVDNGGRSAEPSRSDPCGPWHKTVALGINRRGSPAFLDVHLRQGS